jgi:tetratricopeptide (TPR) repeat protein
MDLETERMPGAFCPLGVTLQFVREVAPWVDDVRFFFYDQVSPLDEVWIVDHVFYVRRHPVRVYDFVAVVRYLDDLLLREKIRDPALGAFLAERMTSLAAGQVSCIEKPYLDPATHRREAEELMARAARHDGEEPPYLLAKLALLDGQVERAIAHLEKLVDRGPPWRQAMLELAHLYFAQEHIAEALDMCDRVVALGDRADDDAHLLRARTLVRLGRQREAMTAYRRHAKVISCYPGVLLRNGNALLEEGQHQAAGILFKTIVRARFATGVGAELGLARCADGLGDRARALEHYRRVLARAPELKRRYADSLQILAGIEEAEQAARSQVPEP